MIIKKKPFIIICRNRLSLLINAIEFAKQKSELVTPIVADMGSEYPPLKKYLDKIDNNIQVLRLENLGPRNLWKHPKFTNLISNTDFYLSDGDIDYSFTSSEVFEKMIQVSEKYPGFRKIGSAIRIDDLNENTIKNELILKNEKSNWLPEREIEKNIYLSPVDTVFAYYPKYTENLYFWPALRLAGKYQVRHSPWYETEMNRTEEEIFYAENAKWWGVKGKTSGEVLNINALENDSHLKIIKFSNLIKVILKYFPKSGSVLLSQIIRYSNPNSFIGKK